MDLFLVGSDAIVVFTGEILCVDEKTPIDPPEIRAEVEPVRFNVLLAHLFAVLSRSQSMGLLQVNPCKHNTVQDIVTYKFPAIESTDNKPWIESRTTSARAGAGAGAGLARARGRGRWSRRGRCLRFDAAAKGRQGGGHRRGSGPRRGGGGRGGYAFAWEGPCRGEGEGREGEGASIKLLALDLVCLVAAARVPR